MTKPDVKSIRSGLKMRTSLGVLCLIIGSVLCGSGADLDSTAEMVKQLQDSGVLEGVKAELEKMLKDKDARAAFKDQLDQKENDLRAKIAEQLAGLAPNLICLLKLFQGKNNLFYWHE